MSFSEPLAIQCVFLVAFAVFGAGAAIRYLRHGPPGRDDPPPPALPPPLPPPLPESYLDAMDPAADAVGPYAPPLHPTIWPTPMEVTLPASTGLLKVPTHWYRWKDLLGVAFFVLLYFSMQLGKADHSKPVPEEKYTAGVMVISVMFQVFCGCIAMGIMVMRVNPIRWLGLRWREWPRALAIAPICVVAVWVLNFILMASGWNTWIEDLLHAQKEQDVVKLLRNAHDPAVKILMAVSAAIVAPLVEETIFRGYIYPVAKRYAGPGAAMVFSSLVFAAAHGNFVILPPLFVLAMMMCIVYEWTGSLWANISIHFVFNSATVAILLLGPSAMKTLQDLGEDALIARIVRRFPGSESLLCGPGDDCAVVGPAKGKGPLRLLKTDAIVEGVHFLPETPAAKVGWKAVARVISDFAAMGGKPEHFLITVAVNPQRPVAWMDGLYAGILKCLETHGGTLAGGETSRLPAGALISVAAEGSVERKRLVLRSGGRPGDVIAVTGRLGGSIGGRHLTFTPRLAEAAWLTEHLRPSAMMDLSDGLAKDLPRLAAASGCGYEIDPAKLPRHRGCDVASALGDGEDYELLVTIPPGTWRKKAAHWPAELAPLTAIGQLTEAVAGISLSGGWDHFR